MRHLLHLQLPNQTGFCAGSSPGRQTQSWSFTAECIFTSQGRGLSLCAGTLDRRHARSPVVTPLGTFHIEPSHARWHRCSDRRRRRGDVFHDDAAERLRERRRGVQEQGIHQHLAALPSSSSSQLGHAVISDCPGAEDCRDNQGSAGLVSRLSYSQVASIQSTKL